MTFLKKITTVMSEVWHCTSWTRVGSVLHKGNDPTFYPKNETKSRKRWYTVTLGTNLHGHKNPNSHKK